MRAITPNLLWTGNSKDARDPQPLLDAGIQAVVDVAAEEPPASLPRAIIYCRIPLVDGLGNDANRLTLCLETIRRLVLSRTPTIVCCGAGMSRSVALSAAGCALASGADARDVLAAYQGEHPHDVAPSFWTEVVDASRVLSS